MRRSAGAAGAAGADIVLASPKGGQPPLDPNAGARRIGINDEFSLETPARNTFEHELFQRANNANIRAVLTKRNLLLGLAMPPDQRSRRGRRSQPPPTQTNHTTAC